MRSSASSATPFDLGASSVKVRDDVPNPFQQNTVQFGNFELGRAHALRNKSRSDREAYFKGVAGLGAA